MTRKEGLAVGAPDVQGLNGRWHFCALANLNVKPSIALPTEPDAREELASITRAMQGYRGLREEATHGKAAIYFDDLKLGQRHRRDGFISSRPVVIQIGYRE